MLIKHPWNGIKQEVAEGSLEELILKCGKYFVNLEIRNDGYVANGDAYNGIPQKVTPGKVEKELKGKGKTMREAVQDLYNQIDINTTSL